MLARGSSPAWPTGHAELALQLAKREARGEHIGAARLAATQQPGSGLLRR